MKIDHTPAAQPGQETRFSDDQLMAIATAAWEVHSKEAYSPDGLLMACVAVQAALLSKLRAPVADERAAFDPEVLAERLRDVAASHYETALGFGISRDNFERCATDAAKIAQDMASAPVAGEAIRAALAELVECGKLQRDAQQMVWSGMSDRVQDGKRMQRQYDKRQPAALAAGIAALDAAPQASEAVMAALSTAPDDRRMVVPQKEESK